MAVGMKEHTNEPSNIESLQSVYRIKHTTNLFSPLYSDHGSVIYRLGPVNSKTVNLKFHLNQTFYLSLLFHV